MLLCFVREDKCLSLGVADGEEVSAKGGRGGGG